MIEIRRIGEGDPLSFEVLVRDQRGETKHEVTIARKYWERFSQVTQNPELFLDAAFRFLLDREPKEAILRRFNVTVIAKYFPQFESELPLYCKRQSDS